jgi:hypothetical protein
MISVLVSQKTNPFSPKARGSQRYLQFPRYSLQGVEANKKIAKFRPGARRYAWIGAPAVRWPTSDQANQILAASLE